MKHGEYADYLVVNGEKRRLMIRTADPASGVARRNLV